MAEAPISCLRCGAPGPEGAAFCVECGARIPPVPTGDVAGTLASKGNVSRTVVIDASTPSTAPTRRRAKSRPSLPTGVAEQAGNAPTSMSEALKDVILGQIAREVDAPSSPGTVRITAPDGKPVNSSAVPATLAAAPVAEAAPQSVTPQSTPLSDGQIDFALDDIEQSFDALLSEPPPRGASEPTTGDLVEVQALFKQIAANYLGPVRDFMVELGLGAPSKEWLSVCVPAVQSLTKSAQSMGLTDLVRALERLGTAFDEIDRLPGPVIGDVARHVLENAHQDLARLLPEAFAVAEERDRREPIIVQTLLRQVPELRKVALDRIYGAGITRLEMFYVARPQDLADATGLSPAMCERIVARFQSFRAETGARAPSDGRPHEHARLAELAQLLGRQTLDFEKAQTGRAGHDKKLLRKQRADTLLEIQLLLARMGRVDLVEDIEKLPFAKKVETLVKYLGDVKRALGSGG